MLNSNPRKRLITIGISVFILGLFSTGLFWYQNQLTTPQTTTTTPTQLVAKVDGMPMGAPVYLQSADGQVMIIKNGEATDLPTGEYKLRSQSDELGSAAEQVSVQEGKLNSYSFKLQPEADATASITNDSIAKLVKPISSNPVKVDNPTTSLLKTEPNQTAAISRVNATTADPILALTTNSGSDQSKIVVSGTDKSLDFAPGCSIAKVKFNTLQTKLRYFKNCPNGQNGYYSADLATSIETRLLQSSDSSNVLRTDLSPVTDDIVFTKSTGEFGYVRDNQVTTVFTERAILSPTFSPDGKSIIFGDKQAIASKIEGDLYQAFPVQIKMVLTSDLFTNKDKANFKVLGESYFVPRQVTPTFTMVDWLDGSRFQFGDSPRVFNLQGAVEDPKEGPKLPGKIYRGVDGKVYREHQGTLYNDQNQEVTRGVDRVINIKDKGFFFLTGDHLMRINNGMPILAYQDPVITAQIQDSNLILLTKTGNLVTFKL